MPVVINEVEIVEPPAAAPAAVPAEGPGPAEPLHEQLRLLQRDSDARQRRLMAD
jgi:hypothetical protein